MPSNFEFLQPTWRALYDDARQTEQKVFAAPRTCAFSRVSEEFVQSGRRDSNSRPPAPKAGALARLRYAPWGVTPKHWIPETELAVAGIHVDGKC